jgi:hypothetical protein
MITSFTPTIFPVLPADAVYDADAQSIKDNFTRSWERVAKPVISAAAEAEKLREAYASHSTTKELQSTKAILRKAENVLRDCEISFCGDAHELLTGLYEVWPVAFMRSVRADMYGAISAAAVTRRELQADLAKLGFEPNHFAENGCHNGAILHHQRYASHIRKLTALSFGGRFPDVAATIDWEINRISTAMESAKSALLAA